MKKIVIKITPDEKDLIGIRAKILGYKIKNGEYESLKLDECELIFKYNSKQEIYHVLVIIRIDTLEALKEIELFKNNTLEIIMEEKQQELTGGELFDKLSEVISASKEDATKCFDGNKSAGVRFRKLLKEVIELVKVLKKQSLK